MLQKIRKFLGIYWPIVAIILIEAVLFITNYKSGTFLIGWDNLYPELDFGINLKRTIFSAWQEYRSLGYFDGMSQVANLPNDLFRWFLSLFMPTHMVRWVFIFLMHLLGGMGVYFLMLKYVLKSAKETMTVKFVSLFSALFYQYNFATIQMFFLPFELFLMHFAALPWLIYFSLEFLRSGSKKMLFAFTITSVLSSPQAHVPTIFIVYLMVLALLLLVEFVQTRAKNWKRILIVVTLTFCVNAYWGVPFVVSTAQNAGVIANSKNNQMATDDIFYRNNKFGGFFDTATFRGLSLDYLQYNFKTNRSEFMMAPWISHLKTLWFNIPAWTFFMAAVFGLVQSVRKRQKPVFGLAVLFLFSFLMMGTDVPFFSVVSKTLREHIPLFHNIFRFVFTKFSFLYAFSYSIFVGMGLYYLLQIRNVPKLAVATLFSLFLLVYTVPSFRGHFFYENLAAKMPQSYEKMFEFFKKKDPTERIASLPVPWYWAWTQNNWNTIGSGFVWYGLAQPITDRAFDPWNDKNENFYWELEQAVYSENPSSLDSTLDKYDVSWIIFDKSVYQASAPKYTESRYKELLKKSPDIKLAVQFGEISVYRHTTATNLRSFAAVKSNVANVNSYKYDNIDQGYLDGKDYFTNNQTPDVFYPFRSLFSGKKASDTEFKIEETDTQISFTKVLGPEWGGQTVILPVQNISDLLMYDNRVTGEKKYYAISVYVNSQPVLKIDESNAQSEFHIQLPAGENTLQISLDKTASRVYESSKDTAFLSPQKGLCNISEKGKAEKKIVTSGAMWAIEFSSQQSNNCLDLNLNKLYQRDGYLVRVDAKNISTKGLFMGIINQTTRKTDLETYFDNDGKDHEYSFVLNPRNQYGLGYTLHFDNISFGKEKVVNTLQSINVYKIPFHFLKKMRLVKNGFVPATTLTTTNEISAVDHPTSSRYIISLQKNGSDISSHSNNSILYLSQGFNSYWTAYAIPNTGWFESHFPFLFGKKVQEHVMINNWANGWNLKDAPSQYVVLIFWPQYLIFAGLILLVITIGFITYRFASSGSLKRPDSSN